MKLVKGFEVDQWPNLEGQEFLKIAVLDRHF